MWITVLEAEAQGALWTVAREAQLLVSLPIPKGNSF